jgi:hypothetical protein
MENLGLFEIVLDGFAKRASGNIEVAGGDTLSKKQTRCLTSEEDFAYRSSF